MSRKIARLFSNGRSQAVRLPQEFRFEGDCVRIRRFGRGVLLEPMISDVEQWFAAMDDVPGEPLRIEDRNQPRTPEGNAWA